MKPLALLCPLWTRVDRLPQLAEDLQRTVPGAEMYLRVVKGITPLFKTLPNMILRYSETTRYAAGINELARMAREDGYEWLFVGADDLSPKQGWFEEAVRVAEETGATVIGTCDGHNPRVLAGQHATHFLVHADWLEYGAIPDGPGTIMSEIPKHQTVDDLLRAAAISRGTYAHAHKAVVEHLHPCWGFGEVDETYERGMVEMDSDLAILRRLLTEHDLWDAYKTVFPP